MLFIKNNIKNLGLLILLVFSGTLYSQTLTLSTTPTLSGNTASICLDDNNTISYSANYTAIYDSIVWTFTGANISRDTGVGPIALTYTIVGNYAATANVYWLDTIRSTQTVAATISQIAPISIVATPDTMCESDTPLVLAGLPAGGIFSGTGVSGGEFDPDAAGPGDHTITYIVTQGACSDTITTTIFVKPAPSTLLLAKGFPDTFGGIPTYTTCDTTNPFFFEFHTVTDPTSYVSYTFNYGDGTSINGTTFPTAPVYIPHTYASTGLYTVSLTLNGSNGCSRTDEINVFIGVSPSLGFTRSGSNSFCLPRVDSGYIEMCFNILNAGNNDPSTVYTLQYNDGSADDVFTHPPPDSVCHRFYEGSCGFNASASNNSFEVTLTAVNPCGSNTFSNSPIYISEPPVPSIEADPRACVNNVVSIYDSTDSGTLILGSGACINGDKIIWSISPSTYTLNGPATDLGLTFGNTDPTFWFGGAQILDVVFNRSGIYNITQVAGNSAQCGLDTAYLTICIDTVPTSGFTLSDDTICVGQTITGQFFGELFTVCDTVDLDWFVVPDSGVVFGASSAFDTTQQFTFNRPGYYDVILIASNACDSVRDTLQVLVQGIPSANFPSDTAICGLTAVDFSSAHLAPIYDTNYSIITYLWEVNPAVSWSFNGGTTSASELASIDFTTYGAYTVSVTVSNACGSHKDSMLVSLTERPELVALLTPFQDTLICPGTDLIYKASTIKGFGPFSYTWGSPSSGVLNNTDSIYIANITQDTTIFVTVSDNLGCNDSLAFTISVGDIPSINMGVNVTLCYSDSVQLNPIITGGITPFTYLWIPDTGLSSAIALNPWRSPLDSSITYVLQVTDSLGCVYSDSIQINVFPLANVDAGSDQTLCINQGNQVLNSAIPIGGSWSGNGISGGNLFDPVVAGLGIHTLVYSYTDANNCDYTDTILMEVIQQPSLNFVMTPDSGCTDLTITISDSTGVSGHQWFVNDSLFSSLKNPTITVQNNSANSDSIIAIKLVFTASSNCADSLIQLVTVYPKPSAAFSLPSNICAGESIQATQNSVFKGASAFFAWTASSNSVTFNDTTLSSPTLTFVDFQNGADSIFTIQMIVTSIDGCVDTISQNITVHSRPTADFTLPAAACTPLSMNPTNISTGINLSYQWSITPFQNVNVLNSSGATPTFSFITPVSDSIVYSITLTITDSNSCVDSITKTYTTYPQPQMSFTPSQSNGCHPFAVMFTNNSTSGISGQGSVLTYVWDLGNGQTSTDTNITVTYNNTGSIDSTYYIQLIATNSLGCTDTLLDSIIAHPNPIAQTNFTGFTNCAPYLIDSTVINASLFSFANSAYIWNVYDVNGNLLNQYNGASGINHTLNNGGDSVYIELVVQSPFGCANDTVTQQLFYTITNPIANFITLPDTGCSPLLLSLTDSSTAGVNHEWFVNGVSFSTLQNPQITLTNLSPTTDSIVQIKLLITAGSGCGDSITKSVVIQAQPSAQFTVNTTACAGDSLFATNSSQSTGTLNYSWSASSSLITISDSAAAQPYFLFPDNQSGTDSTYTIQLIVGSSTGCADTASQNVIIYSRPVADFTLPAPACAPLSINPTDISTGNLLNYNWSVSPNTNVNITGSNSANPQFNFTPPALDSTVYTISLVISDVNGCTNSIAKNFSVYPNPTTGFTPSLTNGCGPLSISFTNTSTTNITGQNRSSMSFNWDFGNGTTSTDSVPTVTFTNTGVIDSVYVIQLISSNSLGCSDTLIDSITVHPDPRAETNLSGFTDCAPYLIDSSIINATLFPNTNSTYLWNVYDVNGILLNQYNGTSGISHTLNNGGDSVYIELITQSLFGCPNDTSTQQLFYTIVNPVANFATLPDTGCSPLLLTLSDSSTAGANRQWYINGTPFSTAINPQITITNLSISTDSIVNIKLVITAGTGCGDSITKQVVIQPQPIAQFNINPTACAGDSLLVTNTSTSGGLLSYSWTASSPLVQFSSTTVAQPYVLFPDNQSGTDSTYTLQLVVSTSAGCTDTSTQNVIVYSRPIADFILPAAGCAPLSINPVDNTTGTFLTYLWTVSPSTGVILTGGNTANPQLDFTAPPQDSAIYTISLSISNVNGCTDSIAKNFSVYPDPIAGLTPSSTAGCEPLSITFSNGSSSAITGQDRSTMNFNWVFSNGNTATDSVPTQIFTNTGIVDSVYTIQLISTNSLGCSDTIIDSITVHPNPRANIDSLFTLNCAPFLIDSTVAKAIVYQQANQTYIWNVYNGTTGIFIQSFTGYDGLNYTILNDDDSVRIELITTSLFGCDNDTATLSFYTLPDSRPGFIIDSYVGCHPHTINITDTSAQGSSLQWFINGVLSSTLTNPVFTLNNTGVTSDSTYRITLVSTVSGSGCIDSAFQLVTVYPLPDPSFTFGEVCIGNSTNFNGFAQTIDSIIRWNWDFGDGNIDSIINPVNTYTSFGTYNVQLTVTDLRGCSQTFSDSVIVRPNPTADFVTNGTCGADTLCIGQSFTLSDLSTIDPLGGNITQWNWDINNDGTIDYTAQNPQHTFAQPGLYTIKLTIESQYACPDSIVRQIFVQDSLIALFYTDTNAVCGPLDIAVIDSSSGLISTYQWELYSLDSLGNKNSIYLTNQVNPNPIPTLIPSFENDTTYILELTLGNCCETVSFQRSFTLKPLPVANFAILPDDTVCIFDVVQIQLDGLVKGLPDSLILNYGDGTPIQTLQQTFSIFNGDTIWYWGIQSHMFPNPTQSDTVYTISLTAINDCGDSTVTKTILVHPNLVQAFFQTSQNAGCEDLTVSFTDLSFGGNYTAWCFDFDVTNDVCTQFAAVGPLVSHTYTQPGTYTVAQFVNDGCSADTAYTQITVFPSPTANFSSTNQICENDTIFFTNLSTITTGTIVSYTWDFGDSTATSVDPNPVHVYDTAGVFNVWLFVNSLNGCVDSISYPITIYDKPSVDFSFTTACLNEQPIQFSDSTDLLFGNIIQTIWDFGDGNSSISINPTHTYAVDGTYTVRLLKTSSNGCTDSISKTIIVFPIPTADFSIARISADSCGPNQTFQFNNLSANAQGHFWDFRSNVQPNTDTLRNVNSPTFTFSDTGVFEVMLIAFNGFGCSDTIIKEIIVSPIPEVGFTADTLSGCIPLTVVFNDTAIYNFSQGGGITAWHWNFGDGTTLTTTTDSVVYTYNSSGVFDVSLRVETNLGCTDSITITGLINALPTPIPDFSISEANAKTITFINTTQFTDPASQFHWDFGDFITSNEFSPTHIYNIDLLENDYSFEICLTVSNSYNCDSTICKTLEINGYRLYVPNAFAPELTDVGDGNIFLPKGHSMRDYNLRIYDKWGNKLFETRTLDENGEPAEPWDGTGPSGEPLPMGAYAWVIEAQFDDGSIWQGKEYDNGSKKSFGTITLIR